MISAELLGRVACPVCLEPDGCDACRTDGHDHATCAARYSERSGCACGGPDKIRLTLADDALSCACCGARYPLHREQGYVDLVPRADVGEVTRYADHEFHERVGVTAAPPVLSARVKADMMRRMSCPGPGDRVLDLGCGAGKFALYARRDGSSVTGADLAPFFLSAARREIDLVQGDLRRLPFRKGTFTSAYSMDVLEHLDEPGVVAVLREARRALAVDGRLFVYTHAMESSRLAAFQRFTNRVAARLGRRGWIDHEREALRKSDHVNAIASHEHFDSLCARAGLAVAERRYYNVFFKPLVEDLALRLVERARRRPAPPSSPDCEPHSSEPRTLEGPSPSRAAIAVATALTWLLKPDVVLFSGVRTGPFFGLLRPAARAGG